MSTEDRARARILQRLFRGRRDVHARRRIGEGWDVVPGPVRLEDLQRHVRGELEIGLYARPGSPDFVVLKAPDLEGARALQEAAGLRGVPLVPAGDGLRLWVPFSAPVAARAARDLAGHLQTAAGLPRSAWEPNAPHVLPPAPNRPETWRALESLEPMPPWRPVRVLAERLDREFAPLPLWRDTLPPSNRPASLHVVLGAHLELRGPIPATLHHLLEHTRMARTPRGWVRCWGPTPWGMVTAPQVWPDLQHALDRLGCSWRLEDHRLTGPAHPPRRQPALRQEESALLATVLEQDRCRLNLQPPEAARRVALAMIASRARPTLLLTGQVQVWKAEVERDLALPQAEIGILDEEVARLGPLVTVASWSALLNRDLSELARHVGSLVLEPGVDLSGPAVIDVVRQFPARWALTLEPTNWSASPAMRQAWLGDRIQMPPRELRAVPVRPEVEAVASVAARRRRPRRSADSSEQLLLFE